MDNWDDEPDNDTPEQKQVLESSDIKDKNTQDDDDWTHDDFIIPIIPIIPIITSVYVETKLQSQTKNQDKAQDQSVPKLPPTILEVDVKYPSGIVPKNDPNIKRRSTRIYTNDELERLEKFKKINPDLIILSEHIGKSKPQENVQGSSKNIFKTVLISKLIDSLDSLIKNNDYIKLSQNWSRTVFQNEILANIKKQNIFTFDGYSFSIKKTLETLDNISTYLTQRHPSNKITIITKNKKGSKIDDLVFTLYKYIIHILYNASQNNIQDIFEILSLIKLLKQNDDIILKYISANY